MSLSVPLEHKLRFRHILEYLLKQRTGVPDVNLLKNVVLKEKEEMGLLGTSLVGVERWDAEGQSGWCDVYSRY